MGGWDVKGVGIDIPPLMYNNIENAWGGASISKFNRSVRRLAIEI
jgi:hypothetical protein